MPTCRNCNQPVEFKPHPKNAAKMVPFDADGEIHFARCKTAKPKKEYGSIKEMGICTSFCDLPIRYVARFIISGGEERLVSMCARMHRHQIPMTENNKKLINHPTVTTNR